MDKVKQHKFFHKLEESLRELISVANAEKKSAVFCFATTKNQNNTEFFISSLRKSIDSICLNLMVTNTLFIKDIAYLVDGKVDKIIVDVENKLSGCELLVTEVFTNIHKTPIYFFRGNEITSLSAEYFITQFFTKRGLSLQGRNAFVAGSGHLGSKLAQALAEHGMIVEISRRDSGKGKIIANGINALLADNCKGRAEFSEAPKYSKYDLIVGASNGVPIINSSIIQKISNEALLIDLGQNTYLPEALALAAEKKTPVLCTMVHPAFNAQLFMMNEIDSLITKVGKRSEMGITLISGGVVGEYGDFIVDDFMKPTRLIAIAKGGGLVLNYEEKEKFTSQIKTFEESIKQVTI